MRTRHIGVALGLALLAAVASGPAGAGSGSHDPELNFEHAWNLLDRTYAQFEVKGVDWDALYRAYRPLVTPATTDEELWDTLLAMLRHLNDAHVCLEDGSRRVCCGLVDDLSRDDASRDMSLELVRSAYLRGEFSERLDGSLTSGWLSDTIGYLHIGDFKDDPEATEQAIDELMQELAGAAAIVVDVRNNPGGTGRVAELVADRFADRRRHYLRVRTRYGADHGDLGPTEYRNLEPDGAFRFTRPTVVLAHRFTESAGDIFVLAMRVLPHVTVVGDLTAGACSAQFPGRMPNGWTLWVAFKVLEDHHGICWDGIGVPPDLRIRNTPEDIAAGHDRTLEFAVRLLEHGAPTPRDDPASLADLKTSLVEEYTRTVREQGLDAAVAGLVRARAEGSASHSFTPDEVMSQAGQYLQQERYPEAIGLLEVCRQEFPRIASTYAMLAQAHLGTGDLDAAAAILQDGESVEPMLPWEPRQIERVRAAVRKRKLGSAAEELERAWTEGGLTAAAARLRELEAGGEAGPVFDERELNRLGYRLLQAGNTEAAVLVFEATARHYPDSWNAHDSLGEALMAAGERQRSIDSYRRSLELNPGNEGGRAMLERLETGDR
ncbi:MAG: S41 family peptidase [Candidatus Eiseniibacteriota bacterium]|jgi:hypothetical protein